MNVGLRKLLQYCCHVHFWSVLIFVIVYSDLHKCENMSSNDKSKLQKLLYNYGDSCNPSQEKEFFDEFGKLEKSTSVNGFLKKWEAHKGLRICNRLKALKCDLIENTCACAAPTNYFNETGTCHLFVNQTCRLGQLRPFNTRVKTIFSSLNEDLHCEPSAECIIKDEVSRIGKCVCKSSSTCVEPPDRAKLLKNLEELRKHVQEKKFSFLPQTSKCDVKEADIFLSDFSDSSGINSSIIFGLLNENSTGSSKYCNLFQFHRCNEETNECDCFHGIHEDNEGDCTVPTGDSCSLSFWHKGSWYNFPLALQNPCEDNAICRRGNDDHGWYCCPDSKHAQRDLKTYRGPVKFPKCQLKSSTVAWVQSNNLTLMTALFLILNIIRRTSLY